MPNNIIIQHRQARFNKRATTVLLVLLWATALSIVFYQHYRLCNQGINLDDLDSFTVCFIGIDFNN